MRLNVYRLRGVLVGLPFLVVLLEPRPWSADRHVVSALGIALAGLGLALRVWAQEHLHYRLRADMNLTVTGPYQFIRNPLYVGNIAILTGSIATGGNAWLALAAGVWTAAVYTAVVRFEEQRLTRRYGEPYRVYVARVPRWFPSAGRGKTLDLVNRHLGASILAEIAWVGLPLLVLSRRFLTGPFV